VLSHIHANNDLVKGTVRRILFGRKKKLAVSYVVLNKEYFLVCDDVSKILLILPNQGQWEGQNCSTYAILAKYVRLKTI
jgi:hypothetical protein